MSPSADVLGAAVEVLERCFREGRHQIAAAVVGASGAIYVGVHVEATIGRAAICAESVALGNAVLAGEDRVVRIVAVRGRLEGEDGPSWRVVPPCGLCREVLSDYGAGAAVLLRDRDGSLHAVPLADLLPSKYTGTKFRRRPVTEVVP